MFKIAHWNCCGLRERHTDVNAFLINMKIQVFVVNETKLDPLVNFNFKGYKRVAINNSRTNAWGTAIYVRKDVDVKELYLHSGPTFEAVLIRCTLNKVTRDILGSYWPGSYHGNMTEWRRILNMVKHPLIMVGDLNPHHQGLFNSPFTDSRGRLVEEIMDEFDLVKISHGITYRRPRRNEVVESELDVALISRSLVSETKWVKYTENIGSDHTPGIIMFQDGRVQKPVYKVDWGKFRATMVGLTDEREQNLDGGTTLTEGVQQMVTTVQTAVRYARTKTTPRTRAHVAYWSVACQKATNARKAAYRRWYRSRTIESYLLYKAEHARCRRFLREQHRRSFEKLSQQLNVHCSPRLAWSMVHGVAGMGQVTCVNSKSLITELGAEQALKDTHEHFTKLYTSQSGRQAKDCVILTTGQEECTAFSDPFTMAELNRALGNRKTTSPGEDGITFNLLQSLPLVAKMKLLGLYNVSWHQGEVPWQWKVGKIVLLAKLGRSLKTLKGWRPICLLSCLIKLFESMINGRLLWWLERSGQFYQAQNGFRWKRSTHDCLHALSATIRNSLELQQSVGILHMDISAAYDSVDTGLLFEELCSLGLPRVTCKWFQSYLTDRSVTIQIGDQRTDPVIMNRGLTQGSVLSPTLWNIYGARLICKIKERLPLVRLVNFADDFQFHTQKLCPYETATDLENIGETFITVCKENYLEVSGPKCVPMLHTQRKNIPEYITLGGVQLKFAPHTRVLGVLFDKQLTGEAHVDLVRDKCQKRLNVLRALTGVMKGLNVNRLLALYRGYVRSLLDYGASAMNHIADSTRAKLEVIENKGLRLILGALPATATVALQAEAYEFPLKTRWACINTRILAREVYHGRRPQVFREVEVSQSHAKRFQEANFKERKTLEWLQHYPVPRKDWLPKEPFWGLGEGLNLGYDFACKGKKSDWTVEQVTQVARELFRRHREAKRLFCFTDGSKTDSAVGTAFWVPTMKTAGGGSMEPWSSIVTAELRGIKLVVNWLLRKEVRGDVVIFTDSKSAIQALLTNRKVAEVRKDCWDILSLTSQRYQTTKSEIILQWVPSHMGILGNEHVDRLAGEARERPRVGRQYAEFGEIQKEIKRVSLQNWQNHWDAAVHGRYRYEVDPRLHPGRISWKRRDEEVFFT